MHPMEGKVAVITGAAGGIGGEMSKILHSLGATIVALDCNKNGLEELQNYLDSQSIEGIDKGRDFGRVWTIAIGQEDLSAVAAAADQIKKRYGKIDILLNNAGIGYKQASDVGKAKNGMDLAFTVNYLSHFLLTYKQASDVGKAKNGMDLAFTVNYLSHFLLTEKLLETLSNASPEGRVVHLTSTFHWKVNGSALCPLPDGSILASESDPTRQGPKHLERAYANSKLAQMWYSRCMRKKSGKDCSSVLACPSWAATGIAGEEGGLAHLVKNFAFPVSPCGPGITSAINAILRTDEELKEGHALDDGKCFVANSRLLEVFAPFLKCNWFTNYQLGCRDLTLDILSMIILVGQRFTHSTFLMQETSIESQEEVKWDVFYDW
eukprot:CAMPEP_0194127770 /NCGR_PEP_ID=MMETSP0150-20130528/60697_1 /TAXON_ID=122233 /ORGANISM="Chaetoceros debilis, Strain MM31A-1" /LENGTH=378 /DNA_ID=CAMNT_0038821717 /DNA_START=152 /DNA_END=1285 /DNA_ORIENTATION=-